MQSSPKRSVVPFSKKDDTLCNSQGRETRQKKKPNYIALCVRVMCFPSRNAKQLLRSARCRKLACFFLLRFFISMWHLCRCGKHKSSKKGRPSSHPLLRHLQLLFKQPAVLKGGVIFHVLKNFIPCQQAPPTTP